MKMFFNKCILRRLKHRQTLKYSNRKEHEREKERGRKRVKRNYFFPRGREKVKTYASQKIGQYGVHTKEHRSEEER